jgi:hypothetical protein
MVGFKRFLLATSLLLGWAAAAPTSGATGFNVFEKRDLTKGSDASKVCEGTFVSINGGSATVVDLTGCTAVFLYKDDALKLAAHISCVAGTDQVAEAEQAAELSSGSNYAVIVAKNSGNYESVKQGVLQYDPDIVVAALKTYNSDNLASGKAIFVTATTGSTSTTEDTRDKVCGESA